MQDNTPPAHISPFDAIKQVSEDGQEFWSARDFAKILGYTQYNKFTNVIEKAEEACRNSNQAVEDHFTHTGEMVGIGSKAKRKFDTVFLSRYACYLVVQNADPTSGEPGNTLQRTSARMQILTLMPCDQTST